VELSVDSLLASGLLANYWTVLQRWVALSQTFRHGSSFSPANRPILTGHITIEVAQSQLHILKVLSITMASRWTRHSSNSSIVHLRLRLGTTDNEVTSTSSSWEEPPPLDESCINCASVVLSQDVSLVPTTYKCTASTSPHHRLHHQQQWLTSMTTTATSPPTMAHSCDTFFCY
jgi:hypothetical protein